MKKFNTDVLTWYAYENLKDFEEFSAKFVPVLMNAVDSAKTAGESGFYLEMGKNGTDEPCFRTEVWGDAYEALCNLDESEEGGVVVTNLAIMAFYAISHNTILNS